MNSADSAVKSADDADRVRIRRKCEERALARSISSVLEKCGDDEGFVHEEQRERAEECAAMPKRLARHVRDFWEAGWLGGWHQPGRGWLVNTRLSTSLIPDAKPYDPATPDLSHASHRPTAPAAEDNYCVLEGV